MPTFTLKCHSESPELLFLMPAPPEEPVRLGGPVWGWRLPEEADESVFTSTQDIQMWPMQGWVLQGPK